MKYKLYALGAICLMLLGGLSASFYQNPPQARYHQHQDTNISKIQDTPDLSGGFSSYLPLVALNQQDNLWQVTVYQQAAKYNQLTNKPRLTTTGTLSTVTPQDISKPSYQLTMPAATDFLDMPANDSWLLDSLSPDPSLLRNYLSLNLAGEIMGGSPQVRFCELFVNGNYQGVYLATEDITKVLTTQLVAKYQAGNPSDSYILRAGQGGNPATQLQVFSSYAYRRPTDSRLEVIYPPVASLTPELKTYIERDIGRFEKSLYSFDYKDAKYGYAKYIDIDSFVNYFILNEFMRNWQAVTFDTYYYKDSKGKLHLSPGGNYSQAYDNNREIPATTGGFYLMDYTHYEMLCRDPHFTQKLISRYRQLRQSTLAEENLLNYVDTAATWLGDGAKRNSASWGNNYPEAISQLKAFIIARGNWLDQNIENLRQYSHPSKAKKFNH